MQKPRRSRFSASRKWTITGNRYAESSEPAEDAPPGITPDPDDDAFDGDDLPSAEPPDATAAPETARKDEPPSWFRFLNKRRARSESRRQRTFRNLRYLALGLVVGYALAWHGGKTSGEDAESRERENAVRLTPGEQNELDAAYLARYLHRFPEAEQRFVTLRRAHPEWPGLDVDAGRTLLYSGNANGARTALNQAAGSRFTAADAHFVLGIIDLTQQNFREAEASFAAAVAHDPTRPDYYYLWGESLRADGKLLDAAEKYRAALTRNSYETADPLYRLKLWLSEIDSGQSGSDGTAADIDAALAQPLPPMEALFAAADRSIRAGDLRAAAGLIVRAHERTDPTVFRVIMNDPSLTQIRWRPELAELFRPAASSPQVAGGSEGGLTPPAKQPAASPARGK